MKLWVNEQFWQVVEDCLVELHGRSRSDAVTLVQGLHDRLRASPPGTDINLIYHAEQFEIANDLAGEKLNRRERAHEYDRIVHRYYAGMKSSIS